MQGGISHKRWHLSPLPCPKNEHGHMGKDAYNLCYSTAMVSCCQSEFLSCFETTDSVKDMLQLLRHQCFPGMPSRMNKLRLPQVSAVSMPNHLGVRAGTTQTKKPSVGYLFRHMLRTLTDVGKQTHSAGFCSLQGIRYVDATCAASVQIDANLQ